MEQNFLSEEKLQEYKDSIDVEFAGLPAIKPGGMHNIISRLMENTVQYLKETVTSTGDMAQWTPVIMSLIRRTMPTLVGPQMIGIQPLSMPTGRIFVQRVYAGDQEVWGNGTIGTATAAGPAPDENFSGPYSTVDGEKLGWKDYSDAPTGKIGTGTQYPEMSFAIEGVDVSVKTRALKGKITTEVVTDLRRVHGLDADMELSSIMQAELTAEIDREIVGRIISEAKVGAVNTSEPGIFDFAVDADGRWSMEKVMGLLLQIEREATWIAQETRRGRGNFILTSPEVAAYLSMANLITTQYENVGFTPVVNPVGVSYYGMLANRFKVFVDPYMTYTKGDNKIKHTVVVGYKGASQYDSGMFYCPYVPFEWYFGTGEEDFGKRIGIKSRYGIISNPYSVANLQAGNTAAPGTNSYFRKFALVVD